MRALRPLRPIRALSALGTKDAKALMVLHKERSQSTKGIKVLRLRH